MAAPFKSCYFCTHAKLYELPSEYPECTVQWFCKAKMTSEIEIRCDEVDWDDEKCPDVCGMYEEASEEELDRRDQAFWLL